MVIYGVALLSVCLLSGLFAGDLLGRLIGVDANVGGVGIAMLLLVFAVDRMNRRRPLLAATREGVMFWSGIYIPIVVAMAARQNVVAALDGGWAAFFAGALAVAGGMALVPVLSRVGAPPEAAATAGAGRGTAASGPSGGPGRGAARPGRTDDGGPTSLDPGAPGDDGRTSLDPGAPGDDGPTTDGSGRDGGR